MSRIGNKTITVPAGVEVTLSKDSFTAKGPKGTLAQPFESEYVSVALEDGVIMVSRKGETKEARSRHGLYRSLFANVVEGVLNGFSKTLEIKGVGYRGSVNGNVLELLLGYSHPIKFEIPSEIEIVFQEKSQNILTVSGISKQQVGEVASNIRGYRKPEPYKGKGVRYIDEYVAIKAGKSAAK